MADFGPLVSYLRRVPAVGEAMGTGDEGETWWCKFVIDIKHPLAWRVVQELGHVLNYLRDLGVAYARSFIEDAKFEGVVKAAIERAGIRGVVVAPLKRCCEG